MEENTASSSANTLSRQRLAHMCHHCECHEHPSPHSSPYSASLPSPPDSPPLDPYADIDLGSISSFPSGESSVFFSSSAGSPHSIPRHQEHEHDAGLIIPSLTLPSALRHPTAYGQTLGDLSLLLVGPSGSGKTALAEFLADADDVVDSAEWEDVEGGCVLRVSTDWIEEHDPHGLERFEGACNVTLTELDGYDCADNPGRVAERLLNPIHGVFRDVRAQIDSAPSSSLLHSLLASSHSPLYTALIYVTATQLTDQDREVITALSSSIPVIPLCTTSLSSPPTEFSDRAPKLASFLPHSQFTLRAGLFRTPQTVAGLRTEAADRFMRWREAERAIEGIASPFRLSTDDKLHIPPVHRRGTVTQYSSDIDVGRWNKAAWEAMLSEDVARRLRETRAMDRSKSVISATGSLADSVLFSGSPCFAPALDPLHFRSLMLLSLSIFAPHSRLPSSNTKSVNMDSTCSTVRPSSSDSRLGKGRGKDGRDVGYDKWRVWRWGLALFCAGVGIGYVLSAVA